ncbi:hypothetical protein PC116_g2805 [Phytophthora cactorum]|uniref:Uncharacterized protein n=2 Tax=Phytophthora cactorum TaxID=29920 RepID=A0A329SBC3_9STRA|nr:hypothetical protein Pcac1_g23935 [Phytophthora cactorum]KAG2850734.1 hypothetical protein PC113_g16520 [Phytophthora cactorum]KAG3191793.1 hypothetical protein C6341_g1018 [Phytophthora cactorum]KAG4249495.1 hypothetical protein PC116_g2805 [Phytophthora cactorum]RAW34173.1 hypothetical protein PC110_g9514 [Phytophthora cactorum]
MAPARRIFPRKDATLDRAVNVVVNLPSFNFVETRPPRRRRDGSRSVTTAEFPSINGSDQNPTQPASLDLDDVLYATVSRRAEQFEDPSMTLETKMARIWQALLRHSESGRFGNPKAGPVNPICTALCLEATEQILAACGASALLRNVLVGGLANSIYAEYDPDQGFEKQQQYADVVGRQSKHVVAQEEEIVKLVKLRELAEQHVFDQLSAAGVGQLLQQMDLSRRVNAVTEMLAPVLDDELLLVLWNATATTQASANQLVRSQASDNDEADPAQEKMSWKETRKRGAALASLVLQERVRLVILVWQRLSPEEKNLAYKALDPSISATQAAATLKSVLHALEETYVSELIHHQRQLSRRNLNLASQLGIINESKATTTGRQLALAPTTPRALGKLRISRGRSRTMLLTGNTVDSGYATAESKASIPQVLLGALVSSSPGHGRLSQVQLSSNQGRSRPVSSGILPEQLLASHTDVLRTCEDVFDLLCEVEQQQVAALERHNGEHGVHLEDIEEGILMQARVKLRDLLCTYIEPSEPIQERFHRCEEAREKRLELDRSRSDDERKLTELVRAIISGQRRNPELLVNVVNRSPETLLSAMSLNPGMLLFSIVKFPEQVKRFLSLDSKACDYLDALVQKHKGVQLLWRPPGGNYSHDTFLPTNKMRKLSVAAEEYALALPVGDSLEQGAMLLLEWFTSHLNDLTELLLEHPKPLQLLFSKMHQRGDVSAFYQMMLLLQQTPGVQNFISRASVGTLERLALEDQTAVLAVLREIFQCRENCTESGESPQPRANRDLLHELQASPHLLTCLSSMDPNVLQEVFLGNVDVWGPFFVDMVASNDALLRQSLVQRTNYAEGGDTLLRLLTAVIDGTTAVLDLEALDRALSAPDVEQEKQRQASARRKEHQCIYLRGRCTVFRAVIAPQIAIVGYNPRRFLCQSGIVNNAAVSTTTVSCVQDRTGKDKGARTLLRPRGKRAAASTLTRKRHPRGEAGGFQTAPISSGDSSTSERILLARGGEVPSTWQLYLRAHTALQSREDPDGAQDTLPALSKARVKALVLDIWLEFLKVDHLQLETASLWSVAPFVCDYLAARYNAPAAVGARLENLLNGLLAFQDDYRVAFFASVCGLGEVKTSDAFESGPPSYDVFLYYMHALAHLFYGQMKIFQSGKRLDETASGSCPIDVQHAVTVTNTLFTFSLTETALRALRAEIEGLPRIRAAAIAGMTDIPVPESTSEASGENSVDFIHDTDDRTRFVELDDLMSIFLQQWTAKTRQTEERYRQAFVANDLGGDRIGMDEFIKIVIGVTAGRISARECRLVFSDAGQEFMTLDVFMRVTRAYQLRVFDTHLPEVNLDERDLQDLRLSVGRANIASTQREVEDLARYWRSVRSDVVHQLEAAHQKKTTKSLLKNQSALIEKLVANTPPLQQQLQIQQPYAKRQATSSAHTAALQEKLDRVWHEVRTCVAMLHRAKLTQHYLSGLFIRSNMLRWIRQARKRAHEEEKRLQSRLSAPLLPFGSVCLFVRNWIHVVKMRGEDIDAVPRTQHLKPTEQVRGIHSGELFVRLNGSKLCEPQGTLHGAHPFLLKLLHLQDNDKSNVQRLVQPSEAKLAFTRNLRRQIRQRRRKTKERWDAVRDVIKVYNNGNVRAIANHLAPAVNPASSALDRYLQQFQRLEQAYKQQVTSDILHVYALLEAESKYITAWNKREEAKYRDQHALTNMLFQFNSFSFQLESETSGQVRMWRLPVSDPQRKRCVKAATENIKKRFFSSPGQSLEVLEVYKIDNRVLLNSFQNFTNSLSNSLSNSPSKTRSEIKIKGLFCSVPADSVERCVAYGMHAVNEETGEPRFLDAQEAEIKVFNRSTLLQNRKDAPGTAAAFRARSKVNNGAPLQFPRRFSRYSTLEEMRTMTATESRREDQLPAVQYLGLCRVAMSKTLRAKDSADAEFPEDPSVGALHFTNEEEYLVRYPDAVVPEFIIQVRIKTPSAPLSVDFSGIIPVSLNSSAPSAASSTFQDFIYGAAFDSPSSTISAFPLALPLSQHQRSFFNQDGPQASLRSRTPRSQQQSEESKTADQQSQIPPETVLANCARQRTQLREDLQRLERLFWARAREVWEEEGIRRGVKIQRDSQHTSDRLQTRTQQLRYELDRLNQMEDELARESFDPPRSRRL